MSLQKLLFTHKPLDTSDKGVQVQSYQNLINEGFEILQTRIITGFSDFLFYSHSIVAGGLDVIS